MKFFKYFLVSFLAFFLYSFSINKEISVKVIIENPENLEFKGGKLYIPKLQKEYHITEIKNFEIQLKPNKYNWL